MITMSVPKGSTTMSASVEAHNDAQLAHSLIDQLGEVIERLVNDHGCQVAMDVYFNEGTESMLLHQLSGEFALTVAKVEEIPNLSRLSLPETKEE